MEYENWSELKFTVMTSEKECMKIFNLLKGRELTDTEITQKGKLTICFEDESVEAKVFITSVISPELLFF